MIVGVRSRTQAMVDRIALRRVDTRERPTAPKHTDADEANYLTFREALFPDNPITPSERLYPKVRNWVAPAQGWTDSPHNYLRMTDALISQPPSSRQAMIGLIVRLDRVSRMDDRALAAYLAEARNVIRPEEFGEFQEAIRAIRNGQSYAVYIDKLTDRYVQVDNFAEFAGLVVDFIPIIGSTKAGFELHEKLGPLLELHKKQKRDTEEQKEYDKRLTEFIIDAGFLVVPAAARAGRMLRDTKLGQAVRERILKQLDEYATGSSSPPAMNAVPPGKKPDTPSNTRPVQDSPSQTNAPPDQPSSVPSAPNQSKAPAKVPDQPATAAPERKVTRRDNQNHRDQAVTDEPPGNLTASQNKPRAEVRPDEQKKRPAATNADDKAHADAKPSQPPDRKNQQATDRPKQEADQTATWDDELQKKYEKWEGYKPPPPPPPKPPREFAEKAYIYDAKNQAKADAYLRKYEECYVKEGREIEQRALNDVNQRVARQESFLWRNFDRETGKEVKGRFYPSNGLSGDQKRYFSWDHGAGKRHYSQIEVFDHNGYHLMTIDPITGKFLGGPRHGRIEELAFLDDGNDTNPYA